MAAGLLLVNPALHLVLVRMFAGCKTMCSDEMPPVMEKQGFKSAESMPRQLNYDSVTKTLRAYPVKEMKLLRGEQVSPLVGLKPCCCSLQHGMLLLGQVYRLPTFSESQVAPGTVTARRNALAVSQKQFQVSNLRRSCHAS
jgi:hypothetical protein